MSLSGMLVSYGLKHALDLSADKVISWVEERFTDQSQTLLKALERANDHAWNAVGLALGGGSFWDRLKSKFDATLSGVREELQKFINLHPLPADGPEIRAEALAEFQRLRKSGRLQLKELRSGELAQRLQGMDRYGDSAGLQIAAQNAANGIADELAQEAPALSQLLRNPINPEQPPLIAAAFSFFFRREIEKNPELAHGLAFDQLRDVRETLRFEFTSLESFLFTVRDRLDEIYEAMQEDLKEIKNGVFDLHAKVDELLKRGERRGISVSTPEEEEMLRRVKAWARKYPPEMVGTALFEKLGQLESDAGQFQGARESQIAVATIAHGIGDRRKEAEALYQQFRNACEPPGQFEIALTDLHQAIRLEKSHEPFPLDRFEPVRIIGAGGFGIVFLVLDQDHLDRSKQPTRKAIKSFYDDLARPYEDFFSEAQVLMDLKHQHIIGIEGCFRHRIRGVQRPYLVLEYFESVSLDTLLAQSGGKLPLRDTLIIARQVALAIHSAHEQNILHRDLKPGNILVRQMTLPDGTLTWEVKVIDFGLAVNVGGRQTQRPVSTGGLSRQRRAVVGTMRYAPPEQKGDQQVKESIGRYSDLYSFGKTVVEMLVGHPESHDELDDLAEAFPEALKQILKRCVAPKVSRRPADFSSMLALLEELDPLEGKARQVREAEAEQQRQEALRLAKDQEEAAEQTRREANEQKRIAREKLNQQAQEWLRDWLSSAQPEAWVRSQAEFKWDEAKWKQLLGQIEESISTKIGKKITLGEKTRGEIGVHLEGIRNRLKEQAEREAEEKSRREAEEKKRIMLTPRLLDCTPNKGADSGRVKLSQKEWGKYLGLKVTETVDLGNGVKMEFVLIPPGKFWMGSPDSEKDRSDNEGPLHIVTLTKPFYIGKYQVTQEEYMQLTGLENPSHFNSEKNWKRHPVEQVSWDDAKAAFEKLSTKKLPKGFSKCSLPTEAQWEYACRAGTRTAFHFGDVLNETEANYGMSFGKTTLVGNYKANPFGLFDMHGNVGEWLQDGWDANAYQKEGRTDPRIESSDNRRFLRGGSWSGGSRYCRAARRRSSGAGYSLTLRGFRLVLLLD